MDSKSGYPDLTASAPPAGMFEPPPPYQAQGSAMMMPQPGPPMSGPVPQIQVTLGPTKFGPYPQNVICPTCGEPVVTKTVHKAGLLTWLASAGCCLIGCFFGCCLIPCCTDFTRDVEHSCTKCGRKLGLHRRL